MVFFLKPVASTGLHLVRGGVRSETWRRAKWEFAVRYRIESLLVKNPPFLLTTLTTSAIDHPFRINETLPATLSTHIAADLRLTFDEFRLRRQYRLLGSGAIRWSRKAPAGTVAAGGGR